VLTISKWMIYIWFGLDGSGIHHSTEFHNLLGPALMVTFAFLGNTLFLTILVSMLSNTFSTIVNNATAEIQFRHAVLTLEGVKGDAIFAYQPPFNVLAMLVLIPLKKLVSPRWFHKIHVFSVRLLNLPLLLIIAAAERQILWRPTPDGIGPAPGDALAPVRPLARKAMKKLWFWEKWRHTVHTDMTTVFDVPPPDSVLDQIATDDDLTKHLIRRQFMRNTSSTATAESAAAKQRQPSPNPQQPGSQQQVDGTASNSVGLKPSSQQPQVKTLNRRDSIAPFPGLRAELRDVLSESDEMSNITSRLTQLERSARRIEAMLAKLAGDAGFDPSAVRHSESAIDSEVDEDEEVGDNDDDDNDDEDDNENAIDLAQSVEVGRVGGSGTVSPRGGGRGC